MSSSDENLITATRPTVLAFHKLSQNFSYGSTNYTPEKFQKLLNQLSDSGFSFVSISELEKAGEKDILLTFDDGYQHLTEHLPVFIEKHNIKPLIFLPTAFIGQVNSWDYSVYFKKEYHLSISQIKELAQLGVTFGSHGHTHTDFTRLSQVQLADELSESKSILEDILKLEVNCISYPFGRFNTEVIEYAKYSKYKFGFTMAFPENSDSNLTIGRIPVYGFDKVKNILNRMEQTKLYKYEKVKCRFINKLSKGTTILNKLKS